MSRKPELRACAGAPRLELAARAGVDYAARTNGSSEPGARRAARLRVLVVDDNADAADSLAELVATHGHDIELAYDGEQAIRVALRYAPDLALLDINLPGASGYDVAREIRRQPWGQSAVIAAVTGQSRNEDRSDAYEAGCDFHITKPMSITDLEFLLTIASRVNGTSEPG